MSSSSDPITAEEARSVLREAPGVLVVDKREPGGYVTPVECVGDYATYVSRIREDQTIDNGLSFWVVSDNLRKGAALNTVQIAETDHQPQSAQVRGLICAWRNPPRHSRLIGHDRRTACPDRRRGLFRRGALRQCRRAAGAALARRSRAAHRMEASL